jgi:hypothetical protein
MLPEHLDPPTPYDLPDPADVAPCGCPEWDFTPVKDEGGQWYCEACGNDLPDDPDPEDGFRG